MPVGRNLRLFLPALLALFALLPLARAQSQESESVTEAARRARELKKAAARPAKSFTNDDVKPARPEAATAPALDGGAATAPDGAAKEAKEAKDSKESKESKESQELTELKEQVKQAQADFDLYQRARALQEDNYYSNPGYARDTTGKAKLETLNQQVKDKKQALEELKLKLEAMLKTEPGAADAQPRKP